MQLFLDSLGRIPPKYSHGLTLTVRVDIQALLTSVEVYYSMEIRAVWGTRLHLPPISLQHSAWKEPWQSVVTMLMHCPVVLRPS